MDFPLCWTIHNQYGRSSIRWASKSIFKTSSRSSKIILTRSYSTSVRISYSYDLLTFVEKSLSHESSSLSTSVSQRCSIMLGGRSSWTWRQHVDVWPFPPQARHATVLQVAYPSGTTGRGRPVVDRFLLALPMPWELHTNQPKRTRLARVILEKNRTRISTGGNKIGPARACMLLPFDSYFSEANVALAKLGPAAVERSLLSINLENRAFSAETERGPD